MTIPNLIVKYQKEETVTKLKKVYSVVSQAVMRSQFDNGSLDTWWEKSNNNVTTYFELFYKPYFNTQQQCHSYKECSYSQEKPFYQISGTTWDISVYENTSRCLFYLTDGTFLFFRINDTGKMIIIDLNGPKKPNRLGRDVFILTFDEQNFVVKPWGYNQPETTINKACSKIGGGSYCAAKIMKDNWKISDDYPW